MWIEFYQWGFKCIIRFPQTIPDFLGNFLNPVPSGEGDSDKFASDQPLEVSDLAACGVLSALKTRQYSITEVWSVPYVGTVVNGIMNSGHIKAGDLIYLGPNGNLHSTAIKSIQRKRLVMIWDLYICVWYRFPSCICTRHPASSPVLSTVSTRMIGWVTMLKPSLYAC